MGYTPVSIMTDCGNGYGVALVEGDDHVSRRAGVDLNATDGTTAPRIRIDGHWVDVDAAFATAYRALTPTHALSADSRTTSCHEVSGHDPAPESGAASPAPTDGHRGIGWMVVPALGGVVSYGTDRFVLNDLRIALPHDGLTYGMLGVRSAGDVTRTLSYVGFEPQLSDRNAAISDGIYGALTVGMGIAAFVQPRGGDPELYAAMNGAFDIGAARAHRHLGRGWGSLLQLGAGAILIPVGIWGVGIDRPTVPPSDMYAPPGMAGARDVTGNPYESRFPNLGLNLTALGANQFLSGMIYGISYLSTGHAPDQNAPRASISPTPGGAFLNVRGTF